METDKLKSMILEKAHIGIWTIEIEDGSKPRMYADDCMKALLGITEDHFAGRNLFKMVFKNRPGLLCHGKQMH